MPSSIATTTRFYCRLIRSAALLAMKDIEAASSASAPAATGKFAPSGFSIRKRFIKSHHERGSTADHRGPRLMKAGKELKLGIPKGSLEEMTIELFRKSGWKISTTSRSYFPSIDDETLRCSLARPQEMSRYVESGTLDVGITGRDWTIENGSDVELVCEMIYSKTSFRPTRWVLAVPQDSPIQKIEELNGKRISTEMVNYTKRYFAEREIPVEVEFSW